MTILILFKNFIHNNYQLLYTNCDYITVNFDPFMVLSLEIPDGSDSLYDCLSSYTKKTTLDGENKWKCDKCKQLVQPDKKIKLWKTSNVLIIMLKRYSKYKKKMTL